jgi:tRNA (cmo5U34)-methyltransferase
MPTGKWEFNAEVTEVFDNMLERSIPDYHGMRSLTTQLAIKYSQPDTTIVDLGCSRGAALKPIIDALGEKCGYLGIEVSAPMREAAKHEIGYMAEIADIDLRDEYPMVRASVTLGVLTLQFTPIEYRQKIVQHVYDTTVDGGAFLLVEKILGSDHSMNTMLVDTYYGMKGEHGYTPEQINTKRRSLEGVLVPVTSKMNEELLWSAGFKHVEPYWRHLNFMGWIATK